VTIRETSSTFEVGSSSGVEAGGGNVGDLPEFTPSIFEVGSSSGVEAGAGNVADLPGSTSRTSEFGSSSGVEAGGGNVGDLPSSTFEFGSSSGVQAESKLANIILAAADETWNKFDDMLSAMLSPTSSGAGNLPQFTIYSSLTDTALIASTVCNCQMRLGDTHSFLKLRRFTFKPISWMHERVDVVDATGLTYNRDKYLHSYYEKARDVLSDIGTLLSSSDRAQARSRSLERKIHAVEHDELKFFAFEPTWWNHHLTHLLLSARAQCLFCIP